ncbi:MAG: TetR/AcrR family transcriptional regulator [Actinobacteria bacterium]|jgi:AcrR family transcriptional regulator|nr:MAG: TetR/AcrR family transcriptional regulator [Actinomycetota bacterium]
MPASEPEVPRRTLRKQREKEQRIAAILAAAEKLFAQKGYQTASMGDIADLAEFSTGTIYFYFKNKEDLLIRLMNDCVYLLRESLAGGLRSSDFALADFCQVGQVFLLDFCSRYPEKATILFRETVGQGAEVEEQRKQLFEKLTADIQGGLEEVCRREGDIVISAPLMELIAVLTVGLYAQVAYHYLIWRDESDRIPEISDQTVTFLLAGVNALLQQQLEGRA